MGNRSIFLYFVEIAKGCTLIILQASGYTFGFNYVCEKGCVHSRCGGTEWEDQSVCIDCTWNT